MSQHHVTVSKCSLDNWRIWELLYQTILHLLLFSVSQTESLGQSLPNQLLICLETNYKIWLIKYNISSQQYLTIWWLCSGFKHHHNKLNISSVRGLGCKPNLNRVFILVFMCLSFKCTHFAVCMKVLIMAAARYKNLWLTIYTSHGFYSKLWLF